MFIWIFLSFIFSIIKSAVFDVAVDWVKRLFNKKLREEHKRKVLIKKIAKKKKKLKAQLAALPKIRKVKKKSV